MDCDHPLPLLAVVSTFFGRIIHKRFKSPGCLFKPDRHGRGICLRRQVDKELRYRRIEKRYIEREIRQLRSGEYKVDKSVGNVLSPNTDAIHARFGAGNAFGGQMVVLGQLTLGEYVTFTSYLECLSGR